MLFQKWNTFIHREYNMVFIYLSSFWSVVFVLLTIGHDVGFSVLFCQFSNIYLQNRVSQPSEAHFLGQPSQRELLLESSSQVIYPLSEDCSWCKKLSCPIRSVLLNFTKQIDRYVSCGVLLLAKRLFLLDWKSQGDIHVATVSVECPVMSSKLSLLLWHKARTGSATKVHFLPCYHFTQSW